MVEEFSGEKIREFDLKLLCANKPVISKSFAASRNENLEFISLDLLLSDKFPVKSKKER